MCEQSLSTLHVSVGSKHGTLNENSSMLWHRHLGHISKDRIMRLVREEELATLDFTDFIICIYCIKSKQPKLNKKGATCSEELLEDINTNICGQFLPCIT